MKNNDDFYTNYYQLMELFKDKKHTSSVKLNEVIVILKYFNENINNVSKEELKLYKNILIMAKALAYTSNTFKVSTQENVKEIDEICSVISVKIKK